MEGGGGRPGASDGPERSRSPASGRAAATMQAIAMPARDAGATIGVSWRRASVQPRRMGVLRAGPMLRASMRGSTANNAGPLDRRIQPLLDETKEHAP